MVTLHALMESYGHILKNQSCACLENSDAVNFVKKALCP